MSVLEHVPAVERPRLLDLDGAVAVGLDRLTDADPLGTPLGGAGPAQHRDVAVHDDLVLDEDAVGAVVGRDGLDDRPAPSAQHVDVLLPLPQRELGIDSAGALDVRHETVREPGGRTADEREATVHALTLGAAYGGGVRATRVHRRPPGLREALSRKGLDPHAA